MRAWTLPAFGREHLQLGPYAPPAPGHGELLLRVRAWSLNFRDHLIVAGQYNPRQPLPVIPGSDCCAEVIAAGPGTQTAVGTRVAVAFAPAWLDGPLTDAGRHSAWGSPSDGVFREQLVVAEAAVVPAPAHLDDAEVATLVCAGVTAFNAVRDTGPGRSVATLGTGGVSLFALQLAHALGAEVAITSSSDAKLERARQLGAALGLNYRNDPDWGRTLRRWRPIDTVVELGGAGTLAQSLRAVSTGGTIALIGVLDGVVTEVPLTSILMRNVRIQGIFVGSRRDLADLCDVLTQHPALRPVIHRRYRFAELDRALADLARGEHMGKLVLEP